MNIRVRDGLPFVSASIIYRGQDLPLRDVIIDTGSAGTGRSADTHVAAIEVEVGAMDYGFDLDGIVGMDFLLRVGAIIALGTWGTSKSEVPDTSTIPPGVALGPGRDGVSANRRRDTARFGVADARGVPALGKKSARIPKVSEG